MFSEVDPIALWESAWAYIQPLKGGISLAIAFWTASLFADLAKEMFFVFRTTDSGSPGGGSRWSNGATRQPGTRRFLRFGQGDYQIEDLGGGNYVSRRVD